ncbi:hypothetical protein Syun_029257 [Stephania yunnanensis]|uniref:DWNN domain-containing protein n=1 Tax=Stephania yunnanensis TaxID=152371 RepID=A0AAP0HFV1_9MAGN
MMAAVHYKFKSSKDYKSLVIEGPSISVADLKLTIVESMHLKRPANFILLVFDAQTNEEYLDEATLIPRDTSVIVHRVPRGLRMPIANSGFLIKSLSVFWRIYGWKNEYQGPSTSCGVYLSSVQYSWGILFGIARLMVILITTLRSSKPPTGIPKSMLMTTSRWLLCIDRWSCRLLSEALMTTFEREMEGLPSTRSAIDIPMRTSLSVVQRSNERCRHDSKCCYRSFCDKCIRDCIISKSMCACGATNILADDLVPNKNVRDLLESCQLAKPPLPSHSADLKRKREIEHIIEREFGKARDIHRGLIGREDVASSKLASVRVSFFASFLLVYCQRELLLLVQRREHYVYFLRRLKKNIL